MQIEMMSESIDETLDKDEAEEETEELTNQVDYWRPDCSFVFLYRLFSCILFVYNLHVSFLRFSMRLVLILHPRLVSLRCSHEFAWLLFFFSF
jgi:hypothetical protein